MKLYIFAGILLSISSVFAKYETKYVAVIFRHGERTPIDPYPTDPWADSSYWPNGFGQLTKNGKKQQFSLGKWLRNRYDALMSAQYSPDEIYVHSTDVDRTLMSAEANLAGLFPPTDDEEFDSRLPWQPIPVHTKDIGSDSVMGNKYCRVYQSEYANYIHSDSFLRRLAHYSALMQYMTKHTGRKIRNYIDIEYIYSTLQIEELNNLTLPNWTRSVYPEQMRAAACYSFVMETGTETLSRYKAGPMLKEIASHMRNATAAGPGDKYLKMSVYSAHDNTLANLLNAIKLFDVHCPPFAAAVLIELLYKRDNSSETSSDASSRSEHYVRVLYRNESDQQEARALVVPGCGAVCPLEHFLHIYGPIMPVDWEHECTQGLSYIILILLAAFAVVIFLNVAYHCHMYFWKNEQRTFNYCK